MFKQNSLTPHLLHIIKDKGTEYPYTGEYENFEGKGTYLCRQCGLALYRSSAKFNSSCGWPSFDEEIEENVKRTLDPDGMRMEITCHRCAAHLGHVFEGEGYTALNTRHCVNSASMEFVPDSFVKDTEEGIFAGGCFWGVEHYFKKFNGVLKVESGYIGGHKHNPTYDDICKGNTGHYEAVRVLFDTSKTTYEDITRHFFEIHDPTQTDGQGPDIGQQYESVVFYYDDKQKNIAQSLIKKLMDRDYDVATVLKPVSIFWKAEDYHQNYYQNHHKEPYCHHYVKRF